ncbi:MAG: DMT family transporter [Clostridia bacterium]
MWFALSLVTILFWGGSDLFAKMGTKSDDPYSHWRLVVMVGLVMGIHATVTMVATGVDFHIRDMLTYLPVSAMYILSMVLGYCGLRYIELSVSSPVCNSSGAVTALLCFFFLGERITGLQLTAVALISVGLVALGALEQHYSLEQTPIIPSEKKYHKGLIAFLFPVLYCLIDGMGSALDAYYLENILEESIANIAYEYTFLLMAVFAFIYLRFVRKQSFSLRKEKVFALGALCETAGQFTYIYAMGDNAIVAAPMIASYSVLSVLLSRLFLKEKLKWPQYAVIAVVMVGVAILGME